MLNCTLMRRLLILGLALSLIAAGLAPFSACALCSSRATECVQATTKSPCEQMHHCTEGAQLSSSSDKSCCGASQAPLPELQYKAADLSLAVPTAVPHPTGDTPRIQRLVPIVIVQDLSLPTLQSLLCTFLI